MQQNSVLALYKNKSAGTKGCLHDCNCIIISILK